MINKVRQVPHTLGRNSQRPTNDGVKSPRRKSHNRSSLLQRHNMLETHPPRPFPFTSCPLLARVRHVLLFIIRQQPTCNRSASCSLPSTVTLVSPVCAPKSRLIINTKCTATVTAFTNSPLRRQLPPQVSYLPYNMAGWCQCHRCNGWLKSNSIACNFCGYHFRKACRHFARGRCRKGDQCGYKHMYDLNAQLIVRISHTTK